MSGNVNRHEHTPEVVPATFHTVFLPKLSEGTLSAGRCARNLFSNSRRMKVGHHVLEKVASLRNETLSLVLSVRTFTSFQGQQNAHVFL